MGTITLFEDVIETQQSEETHDFLAQLSTATRMLAEARTFEDAKAIRDIGMAAQVFARAKGLGADAIAYGTDITLEAERLMGAKLLAAKEAGELSRGGRPAENQSQPVTGFTLPDLGITKNESAAAQACAQVPDSEWQEKKVEAIKRGARTARGVASGVKKEKARSEKQATRAKEAAARPPEPESPFVHLYVTEAQHLEMIDDGTVDIIITSPPYNLGDDTWPMGGNGRATRDGMEYSAHADNMEQCEYERWQIEVFQELYRVAKVGASFFYNHKPRTVSGHIIHPVQWLCNPANPWTVRQEIIWDRKSTHNHSASLFWPIDERIYWMTKGRPELNGESIGMPTIWQEFGPVAGTWHPAPFTLELPRMLLKAIHAAPGAVVLDPFAGSCTTLKAALELGCVAVGVDIEREYLLTAAQESGWRHAL